MQLWHVSLSKVSIINAQHLTIHSNSFQISSNQFINKSIDLTYFRCAGHHPLQGYGSGIAFSGQVEGTVKRSRCDQYFKLTLTIRDNTYTINLVDGGIGYNHVIECGSLIRKWNVECLISNDMFKLYFLQSA